MIFRKSLTARFITAVFVLLLLGQAAGLVLYLFNMRTALFESLQVRMKRAATLVAGVGSGPLLSYDYSLIDLYLEEVSRDDDMASIHLTDEKGKVVREKIKRADEDIASLNPLLYSGVFEVKAPVLAGGKSVGQVVIHFGAASINEALGRSMLIILLYQIILLIAVGFLLMFLFGRHVRNPVAAINRSVEKITLGDLTVSVPHAGEDEVGSIARGITFLEEKLASTIARINATAVNVSMAVKQVDFTYRNVMDGISKQSSAVKDVLGTIQHASRSQAEISESTVRLQSFSGENVSSLLEMKSAAEEIAGHTQRLFRATEDAYSVAVQLSQSSKVISESIGIASSGLDDTSASVEEIEASIKEVAEHARESSQLAEQVKEITSGAGMMSVVNAIEGMEEIADQAKRSADIILQLGTRSTDIEKVLSVIKDVTEQTNLLSLNAAILAAQAGEYGKSFSVVAEEIRALSERTVSSTREIGGIVKTIQRDIRDAVQAINMTQAKVGEGNSLVVKVGEALRDILNASIHSSDMTKSIDRATEEQSLGLRQITAAIENIRRTTSHVVKATDEEEKALSHLLERIGDVKEVAEQSRRGTLEQAEGVKLMSKNIEMANDRISQINQLNQNQKKLNSNVVASVEQIDHVAAATALDMQEVTASLQSLAREIDALKQEMDAFRTA